MLYRGVIAVCTDIHTKHTNALCGQNVEFMNVKPVGTVHKIAAKLERLITLVLILKFHMEF